MDAFFLKDGDCVREGEWTQSIAVGTQGFVEKTKQKHGISLDANIEEPAFC